MPSLWAFTAALSFSLASPPPVPPRTHRPDTEWPFRRPQFGAACLGEYSYCPSSRSCVLDSANATSCSMCGPGEYLCPDLRTCATNARGYLSECPNINGSHLDPSLSTEQRLDWLVAHTSLRDWVGGLGMGGLASGAHVPA